MILRPPIIVPFNCAWCGRFTIHPEWYVPWGGPCDLEPDDPAPICERCCDKEYRAYLAGFLKNGIPPIRRRPYWQSPAHYHRARATARAIFKAGVRPRPLRHERVRWETRGRGDTFEVCEWCACGWSTGWGSGHDGTRDYLLAGGLLREHLASHRPAVDAEPPYPVLA